MDKVFLRILGILSIIFLCFLIVLAWSFIRNAITPRVILYTDENVSIVEVADSDIPHNLKEGKRSLDPYKSEPINTGDTRSEHLDYSKLPKEITNIFDIMEKETKQEKLVNYYRELGFGLSSKVHYEETIGDIAVGSYVYTEYKPELHSRIYKPKANEPNIAVLSWENVKKAQEKTANNLETTKKERRDLRAFNALDKEIQDVIKKHAESFSPVLDEILKQQSTELRAKVRVLFPEKILSMDNGRSEKTYYPDNTSPDKKRDIFIVERRDRYRNNIKSNQISQHFLFVRDKTINSIKYFLLSANYEANRLIWVFDNYILYTGWFGRKSVIIDVNNGIEKDFLDAFGITEVYMAPDGKKAIMLYNSEIGYGGNSLYGNMALLEANGLITLIIKCKRTGGNYNVIEPLGWHNTTSFYFKANNKYWNAAFK